jgi:hypothetical protein
MEPQRLAAPQLRGASLLVIAAVGAGLAIGTGFWSLIGTN